jgi:hypothetical protein
MELIYIIIRKIIFAGILAYSIYEVGLFSKILIQKYITKKKIDDDKYYWILVFGAIGVGILGGLII